MANYQTFAKLYDNLFDEEMYEQWYQFVKQSIKQADGKILELAGGAGRLAVMLAKTGYDVSVFDLSPEMLSLAMQHAQEAAVDISLIEGDMTEWSDLPIKYQTITCFADSLNYLTNKADIKATFQQVYDHLVDDGQFMFDVITPYQANEVYPGYMYNWHDEETAFMWSSYFGEKKDAVEHELTFFVYQEDIDGYRQIQEVHVEQTYDLTVYETLLRAVGFKNIKVTAEFGTEDINEKTTRWFFDVTK